MPLRSRARRDKRFANKGVQETAITQCPQCAKALIPHQACRECGFYKGAKVLKTKSDRSLKRKEHKKAAPAAPEASESQE